MRISDWSSDVCSSDLGGEDPARGGEMLDTRGDVHRLAEVVLPLVEAYGDAGALVDADLQQQILTAARLVEFSHRLAHAQGGGDRPVGCRKGRHQDRKSVV